MDDISQQISEELTDLEPQVTSPDPNERKLARKLRIERRLEALKRQNQSEQDVIPEETKEKTLTQIQIEKSIEVLKKVLTEGEERVTNIRTASDAREAQRRSSEGDNREKIIEALEEEAQLAEEAFNQISEKWLSILKSNDPLHINDKMILQKEKCEELMKQKDGIIMMLKEELATAEKKFGSDQRRQIDDICLLTNRIEKQIAITRNAYREQLKLIEESMQEQRRLMMELNAKKWEELYNKRNVEEQSSSDKKYEQMEDFDNQLTELRREFQEKYRENKIKLERDIDSLEQELERIKALAILNAEKLDYNYQILKKREDENIIIKSQQKRRINKLQDIVNTLKRRITEYSEGTKQKIIKVTDEITKLQKNILDIESKADHFAEINDVKFNQLWDMNTERVMHVAKRILTIDRILHEQLLGLPWNDQGVLQKEELKKENLPSYKYAVQLLEEERKELEPKKSVILLHERNPDLESAREAERQNLLKCLMQQIADRAGFILEDRLQQVLEPFLDTEKTLVRMDNVFSALNITKDDDINELLEYFLPYTHCAICTAEKDRRNNINIQETIIDESIIASNVQSSIPGSHISGDSVEEKKFYKKGKTRLISPFQPHNIEEIIKEVLDPKSDDSESDFEDPTLKYNLLNPLDNMPPSRSGCSQKELLVDEETENLDRKMSCEFKHPLIISSVYVLKALRHFVSNYYEQQPAPPTMAQRLSRKRNTICRLVEESDIKKFWEQFKNIFTEDNENVWNALSDGLTNYHAILKDRKHIHDDVVELRKQNRDLKNLLKKYIEDPTDPNLGPPCAYQRNIPREPKKK